MMRSNFALVSDKMISRQTSVITLISVSSDITNAKAWAKKGWSAHCRGKGPNSDQANRMENNMHDPRAHRAFGLGRRQKLSGPEA